MFPVCAFIDRRMRAVSAAGARGRSAAHGFVAAEKKNGSSGTRGRGAGGMIVIRFGYPNRWRGRLRRSLAGQRWQDPGETDAGRDESLVLGGEERAIAYADLVRRSGRPLGGMVAAMRVRRGVFMGRGGRRRPVKRHSDQRHERVQRDRKRSDPCRAMIRSSSHGLASIANARKSI